MDAKPSCLDTGGTTGGKMLHGEEGLPSGRPEQAMGVMRASHVKVPKGRSVSGRDWKSRKQSQRWVALHSPQRASCDIYGQCVDRRHQRSQHAF